MRDVVNFSIFFQTLSRNIEKLFTAISDFSVEVEIER